AGMGKSFFVTELDSNLSRSIAKGHLKNKEELRKYHLNKTLGDKGIYSNPEELFKWKIAFFDKGLIIPKSYLEMAITQQNIPKGKVAPAEMYGYGLRLEKSKFYGDLIYHGGLWRGYQNLMIYRPLDNIFIVFLSNFRNSAHKGKGTEVLHILDGA
ncbi:serine hydrolase, partial [Bacteroidales bacterium OttesenSCG-928-L19]|nr:serine hydrolase [Bacteroidales bacterium OttesenSCG-928-L19]